MLNVQNTSQTYLPYDTPHHQHTKYISTPISATEYCMAFLFCQTQIKWTNHHLIDLHLKPFIQVQFDHQRYTIMTKEINKYAQQKFQLFNVYCGYWHCSVFSMKWSPLHDKLKSNVSACVSLGVGIRTCSAIIWQTILFLCFWQKFTESRCMKLSLLYQCFDLVVTFSSGIS